MEIGGHMMKTMYFVVFLMILAFPVLANNQPEGIQVDSGCYYIGSELFCNGKKCVKVGDQFLGC